MAALSSIADMAVMGSAGVTGPVGAGFSGTAGNSAGLLMKLALVVLFEVGLTGIGLSGFARGGQGAKMARRRCQSDGNGWVLQTDP